MSNPEPAACTTTIGTVLISEQLLLIDALRALLASCSDIRITDSAANGNDGLLVIQRTRPAVAIVDLSLPDLSGLNVVERAKLVAPNTRCIVLNARPEAFFATLAVDAGARGYVLKGSPAGVLLSALRSVAAGRSFMDPSVTTRPSIAAASGRQATEVESSQSTALSRRELEVLRLTALGLLTKEIASRLGVAAKSVETYRARGSQKLHLGNRASIVRYALAQGWLQAIDG